MQNISGVAAPRSFFFIMASRVNETSAIFSNIESGLRSIFIDEHVPIGFQSMINTIGSALGLSQVFLEASPSENHRSIFCRFWLSYEGMWNFEYAKDELTTSMTGIEFSCKSGLLADGPTLELVWRDC
jgi:hypothetical protein